MADQIRLFALAHGRSGDKGDSVNVGVIARRPEWYDLIAQHLTTERVTEFLSPLAKGPVERYELKNIGALNFLVHQALDGGGSLSMKLDAQGKTYAQALLKLPIPITPEIRTQLESHWNNAIPRACSV